MVRARQRRRSPRLPGRDHPSSAGPKPPRWRRPLALALTLALVGGAAAWVVGRGFPGPLGRGQGPIVVGLPDGASITVPRASVAGTPEFTAHRLEPPEFPPLPGWVEGTPVLYEFSLDRPLRGSVVIRVPLPTGADLALLAHFHRGAWRPVPFRRDGRLAAAEVEDLSIFGFLEAGYGAVEDWLRRHPRANWLLGGYLRWAVTFDARGRLTRTDVLEPGYGP